jgi:hypothetical protein
MQIPLNQISAGRDTTTWRPCGITANPSKMCCLGIQHRRLQAASFSSGTGLQRCWNFYLKRKPVPGGERRLRNAKTRNLYPSLNISLTISTRIGQSALAVVMGEIINVYRVTAGKLERTSPLAILTYNEKACLTRGTRSMCYPRQCRVASEDILYVMSLKPFRVKAEKEPQSQFGGGGRGNFMSCFLF